MKFLTKNRLAYLLNKILGIDFIVEEGRENNWNYRKWNSGIAECWQYTSAMSIAMTAQSGTGYYYTASNWTFPIGLFISAPAVTINTKAGSGLINACCNSITKDGMGFFVYCTVAHTVDIEFMNYAIGNWK